MNDIPDGLCQCGCGQPTQIAKQTVRAHGWVKGKPRRFIMNHDKRAPQKYEVRDCGYETPCHIWLLGINKRTGYPMTKGGTAHRRAYIDKYGAVPDGYDIHHKCRQILCVNPDHLEPLAPSEHQALHERKRLSHCHRGHPLSEDNLWISAKGKRHCRACKSEYSAKKNKTLRTLGKTCYRGHPLTPDNTLIEGNGARRCLICRRASQRAAREKRRAAKQPQTPLQGALGAK